MMMFRLIAFCWMVQLVNAQAAVEMMTWTRLDGFQMVASPASNSCVVTSPWVATSFPWVEAIPSWNIDDTQPMGVKVELRAGFEKEESRWYNLGWWSMKTNTFTRRSDPEQRDSHGVVLTDTLRVSRPATHCQMRVTIRGRTNALDVRMLGLCLSDPAVTREAPPQWRAVPRELRVPQLSQGNYPGGETAWCSPTSLAMVLNYWGNEIGQNQLCKQVPEIAEAVFDPLWPGTGNWAFNIAYAGSFSTLRATVARFENLSQIEPWLHRGVPIVLSVAYPILKGLPDRKGGHLVVCVGFTEEGDVILNDPGSKQHPRLIVPCARVEKAWAESGRTAYVIHPKHLKVPAWTTSAKVQGLSR